jgi:thermitase
LAPAGRDTYSQPAYSFRAWGTCSILTKSTEENTTVRRRFLSGFGHLVLSCGLMLVVLGASLPAFSQAAAPGSPSTPPDTASVALAQPDLSLAAAPDSSRAGPITSGEILVKFKPGTSSQTVAAAHAQNGARLKNVLPQIDVQVIEVPTGQEQQLVALYRRHPSVLFAETNPILSTVQATYQVTGRVTDTSNTPQVGATVAALTPGTSTAVTSTTTAADGSYTLSLNVGTYDFKVTPPTNSGFQVGTQPNVSVTGNMTLNFTLVSASAVTLSGHVTGAGGAAVQGALIRLTNAGVNVVTATDSTGAYTLSVSPGTYSFIVNSNGSRTAGLPNNYSLNSLNYSVSAATTLDLPLASLFKQVAMHVQDSGGGAVSNVTVNSNSAQEGLSLAGLGLPDGFASNNDSRLTDSQGNTTLYLLPTITNQFANATPYTLTATPPSGSPYSQTPLSNVTFTADTSQAITLLVAVTLSGHVTGAGGAAVQGALIRLTNAGVNVVTATDSTGAYTLSVSPGTYSFIVNSNGSRTAGLPNNYSLNSLNYSVSAATTLDLPLASLFKQVAMHVQDSGGGAVSNVTVNSNSAQEGLSLAGLGLPDGFASNNDSRLTDSQGNTTLYLLPTITNQFANATPYTLTATPPSGSPFAQFSKSNVTFTGDDAETFILQFVHAPPVTTTSFSPAAGATGAYPDPVAVTLSATATPGFSIANTYYKLDGGAQQTYTTPFQVAGFGGHTLAYWSVDSLGVYELPNTLTFQVGTPTPTPTSTSTSTPTATATSTGTPVATDTPTQTPTSTNTPVATDTPTQTPTSTNTPVATDTPTQTPTSTSSPTNTSSPTPSPTSTATSSPAPTNTITPTPAPTNTPRPTATSPAAVPGAADPYLIDQWGFSNIGQFGGVPGADIHAFPAWNITTGDPSVAIAILDTGIDSHHVDLQGKVTKSVNFTGSPTVEDVYGHGTHVAGTAAADINNGLGGAGTCPKCTLFNVKVLGDNGRGSTSALAQGIIWATDNGAKVISMSIQGGGSSAGQAAVDYAWQHGVVVVAAAGNHNTSIISYPGGYQHVIAVAATNDSDAKAGFSNYGWWWVPIAAPGTNIFSTYIGNYYGVLSGTSMATPHVAGVAGLIWSLGVCGGTDNACVVNRITTLADPIAGTGDSWDYGRLNAYRSLSQSPLPTHTPPPTTPTPLPTPDGGFDYSLPVLPPPFIPTPLVYWSATPTLTPASTMTPTATSTATASPTSTNTPIATDTPTATPTATASPSATPTNTSTPVPYVTLSGRLADRNNNGVTNVPAAPVTVRAVSAQSSNLVPTDNNGRYSLQISPGVVFHLEINAFGGGPPTVLPVTYVLTTGDLPALTADTTLDIQIPSTRACFQVNDTSGNPVANMVVTAHATDVNMPVTLTTSLGPLSATATNSPGGSTGYSARTDASGSVVEWLYTKPGGETTHVITQPDAGTRWIAYSADIVLVNDTNPCIVIVNQSGNHPPTANAGGPYQVVAGQSITLTGTGTDADGDTLTYAWDLTGGTSYTTLGQVVTFSAAAGAAGTSKTVALRVCDPYGGCGAATATVNIVSQLRITSTSPLPSGTLGVAYSTTLLATGGTTPYVWSVDGGQLSPGLGLNSASGEISGTPTTAGSFSFVIRVTDSSSLTTVSQFTLSPPPSSGTGGQPYQPTPIQIIPPPGGGTTSTCSNYVLAPGSDALPPGMSLDPATGVLGGTPTNGGSFNLIVQCTYNTNQRATAPFVLTINNPVPALTGLSASSATAGGASFALVLTGSNFVDSSSPRWNGTSLSVVSHSATQITATVDAALLAGANTATVTVVNPGPGGGTSNGLTFTVKSADTTPPTVQPVVSPVANAAGWNNSVVNLSWNVADAESGISSSSGCASAIVSTETLATTLTCSTTNGAGLSTSTSVTIRLDTTPPGPAAATFTGGTQATSGWYRVAPTTTLASSDNLSGVAAIYYQFVAHGAAAPTNALPGAWLTFGTGFAPPVGDMDLYAFAIDVAGNVGNVTSIAEVKVDIAAPTTTASVTGTLGNNGWWRGAATVVLSASDGTGASGVHHITYSSTGAQNIASTVIDAASGSFKISSAGTTTVTFFATDNAGNVEAARTVVVKVDSTAPSCVLSKSGTNAQGQSYIQITVQDKGSGLSTIAVTTATNVTMSMPTYAVGTTTAQVVTATKIDQTQSSQVSLSVLDVAGNTTACDPILVTIKSTGAPTFTFTSVPQAESRLSIYNGTPGLSGVVVVVNGTPFSVSLLKNGQVTTVDLSSAMLRGNNTIVLATLGRPGGSANILFWDGIQ